MERDQQNIIANLIRWLGHPNQGKAMRARKRLVACGAAAVEPLIEATRSPQSAVRLHAMIALAYIGDVRAFDSIATMTRDPDQFIRYESAWAIAQMRDRRSLGVLLELMQRGGDRDGGAGAGSAQFIDQLGVAAVGPLVSFLKSEDQWLAATATYCLAGVAGERSERAIAGLLDRPDDGLRHAAVESLGRMAQDTNSARRILPLLETHRADSSEKVRHAVESEIQQIRSVLAAHKDRAQPVSWRLRLLASERCESGRWHSRPRRIRQHNRRRSRLDLSPYPWKASSDS